MRAGVGEVQVRPGDGVECGAWGLGVGGSGDVVAQGVGGVFGQLVQEGVAAGEVAVQAAGAHAQRVGEGPHGEGVGAALVEEGLRFPEDGVRGEFGGVRHGEQCTS